MLAILIITSILSTIVSALSEHNNVALYWGQNSAGTQETLASYCQSESADIYILSFMDIFGYSYSPQINFANACETAFEGSSLLHCSNIAADIKTCQSLGKKVLLSLGGASGAYGFSDDASAETFATTLWNTFGAGSDSSVKRPFDDSIVDGFDFDIENNIQTGYAALASKLRSYFDGDNSKQYYLSAAPQCPFPDASVGDLLANADLDFAFIQFYNNYCSTIGNNFNWKIWADFAKNDSPNKNIQIFLGLPAAPGAAGSGYSTIDNVKSIFENDVYNVDDSNFGGFVLWDASWSKTNRVDGKSYGDNLQEILDSAYNSEEITTEKTTSTTSTTSSTTSTTSTTPTTSSTTTTSTTTSSTTTTSTTSTTSTTPTTSTTSTSPTTSTTSTTPAPAPAPTPATSTSTTSTNPTTSTEISVEMPTQNVDTPTAHTTLETKTTSLIMSSETNVNKEPNPTTTSNGSSNTDSTDCSSLSGLAKAQCMNNNFKQGKFLGSSSSCTENEIACDGNGAFAICNFGNWVSMQCAAGTTCYAYNVGDDVEVGCDYIDSKSKFEKRDNESFFSLLKRHVHHMH
ncbi:chitinase [Pichia kluyveri]|uniref:chitinase n=1 Tax=Pichia kluyveri TaxID=36015 RepID=A0AAV5RBX2_PICKL|nr:chitinase [Pichia kluyveri]